MHSANMAKAHKDCEDHKNHVRSEREKQREGGNQYPAFKRYEWTIDHKWKSDFKFHWKSFMIKITETFI